jgi:hypothetical protein
MIMEGFWNGGRSLSLFVRVGRMAMFFSNNLVVFMEIMVLFAFFLDFLGFFGTSFMV